MIGIMDGIGKRKEVETVVETEGVIGVMREGMIGMEGEIVKMEGEIAMREVHGIGKENHRVSRRCCGSSCS